MFGIVIDELGYKVEFIITINDIPYEYELKDGERIIKENWQIANSMNKPQWNGSEWIDIDPLPPQDEVLQEPSKMEVLEQEVLELETMSAGLLLENAEQKIKNAEQEITNANLLLEIAILKGAM